jgi:hypothetical protein
VAAAAALSALADPRRDGYAGSALAVVQWYGLLVAVLASVPASGANCATRSDEKPSRSASEGTM